MCTQIETNRRGVAPQLERYLEQIVRPPANNNEWDLPVAKNLSNGEGLQSHGKIEEG
jgi:hypothetical protein